MGLDIPPNDLVVPNKIPITQNDFLLMQKKNKDILAKNPKNIQALVELGYASRNLNDLETDIGCCNKALELNPAYAPGYSERGMAYEGSEDFEKALSDFTKAISLDSHSPIYYANLGRLYLRTKKTNDAIHACTTSINMAPQNAVVFYYRGRAYFEAGNFQKAIEDFDKAINLDATIEIGCYIGRANANAHLNSIDRTIEDLRKAIKIDSDDFPRQMDMAFTRGESENTPEARQRIFDLGRELVDDKPFSPALQKALFNRFVSNNSVAIAEFDELVKQYPQCVELYLYRGETFSDIGEEEKAIDDYSKVLQLEPANPDAYLYRARTFIMRKEYTKAIDDLNQLIKVRPDRFAYIMRSGAYSAIGDTKNSLEDRKRFLTSARNTSIARNNPSAEDFSKLLKRDLDRYFSKVLAKKAQVDFEEIRSTTVPAIVFGLPRTYYWLRITVNGKLVDQGAACLLGVQRERFLVHKFASIAEIRKNPRTIDSTCPEGVRAAIFERAGVSRPL